MGDTDDAGLDDVGVVEQDGLDVDGVDVVAAPDDDVLLATDDVEVAVGVEPGQVAGVEPAVLPGAGGGLGVAVVLALAPLHAQHGLTDLAGGHLVAVVVEDLHLEGGHGLAHRPDALEASPLGMAQKAGPASVIP